MFIRWRAYADLLHFIQDSSCKSWISIVYLHSLSMHWLAEGVYSNSHAGESSSPCSAAIQESELYVAENRGARHLGRPKGAGRRHGAGEYQAGLDRIFAVDAITLQARAGVGMREHRLWSKPH